MEYKELQVLIERKKNKNLYLRVVNDNILYVTCPLRMKDEEVYRFIKDNEDRIRRSIEASKKKLLRSYLYRGGEYFYQFGQMVKINENQNINKLYQDLNKDLLAIGKEYIDKYLPMLKDYGYHQYPELKIRKMKSKWGVCYTQKNLVCLSSFLVHYPRICIEYIVLHELCHFIVPNHSKRFYSLIEQRLPNYKEINKMLV